MLLKKMFFAFSSTFCRDENLKEKSHPPNHISTVYMNSLITKCYEMLFAYRIMKQHITFTVTVLNNCTKFYFIVLTCLKLV